MILFKEDWDKYPKAIVHSNTKNKSWLRLALLYKAMGIDNHTFLLALHDPRLIHVDPWDPNLNEHEISMIVRECKVNPWYYFREVLKIPTPAGPVHFQASRANIIMYWLFFNHITTYIVVPRQVGKSVGIGSLNGYLINTRGRNMKTGSITKDEQQRDELAAKVKEPLEILPPYLQMISKRDVKNSEKITVRALHNEARFLVPGTSPATANNKGRGMTIPVAILDEFAFIRYVEHTIPALLTATITAREIAEKAGKDHGVIFTTTPGKLNTPEGRYAYKLYNGSTRWNEKYLDLKNREQLEDIIKKNAIGKNKYEIMLVEYNHRQLGKTDDWLVRKAKQAQLEPDAIEAELLNKWTGGSFKSPISKELLEVLDKSRVNEKRIEISEHNYVLRWYITEEELERINTNGFLVAGLDTSDAVGRDDIALVIRDSVSGGVVATGVYNETNLAVFATYIAELLMKYKNMVLIPERKFNGGFLIDSVVKILHTHGINPFKRIFNWVYNDMYKYKGKYDSLFDNRAPDFELLNEVRKHLGFATGGSGKTARSTLYGSVFTAATKYTADKTRDKDLINQISSLTIKNNRIDHPEDGHDDMVIAWLLSFWFLTKAENIHLYDVRTDTILKEVIDNEMLANSNDKDIEKIRKQEAIKHQIELLVEQLANQTNEYLAIPIYNKIKKLESMLDYSIVKNFNLDNMLKDIKILKRIKRKIEEK